MKVNELTPLKDAMLMLCATNMFLTGILFFLKISTPNEIIITGLIGIFACLVGGVSLMWCVKDFISKMDEKE